MIIQTTKEINGVVYDYAYSDSGYMIERYSVSQTGQEMLGMLALWKVKL